MLFYTNVLLIATSIASYLGSGGLMVRAPACRSGGRWFDSTVPPISFTPLCPCLSEETLKPVGPNSCVSSGLGCLEYNYLKLEKRLREIYSVHWTLINPGQCDMRDINANEKKNIVRITFYCHCLVILSPRYIYLEPNIAANGL